MKIRMILPFLVLLLSACGLPEYVVITATPSVVETERPTATIVPTLPATSTETPTRFPSKTPTVDPTPTQEITLCGEECSVLPNSQLKPPCELRYTLPNVRTIELPAQWDYVFDQNVFNVPDSDLAKNSPFVKCIGNGVELDITYTNGTYKFQTPFSIESNQKYLLRVDFSMRCNSPLASRDMLYIRPVIFNSSDGTILQLPPQGFLDPAPGQVAYKNGLWLIESTKPNPGGLLSVEFLQPYAICGEGSRLYVTGVLLFPVSWPDPSFKF